MKFSGRLTDALECSSSSCNRLGRVLWRSWDKVEIARLEMVWCCYEKDEGGSRKSFIPPYPGRCVCWTSKSIGEDSTTTHLIQLESLSRVYFLKVMILPPSDTFMFHTYILNFLKTMLISVSSLFDQVYLISHGPHLLLSSPLCQDSLGLTGRTFTSICPHLDLCTEGPTTYHFKIWKYPGVGALPYTSTHDQTTALEISLVLPLFSRFMMKLGDLGYLEVAALWSLRELTLPVQSIILMIPQNA